MDVTNHDGRRQPAGEDSFAKLFERIADAALLVEVDTGLVIEANAAARGLLGYGRDDLGRIQAADIHPHEIPALDRFIAAVVRNGSWEQDDLSCRTKDGAFVPARVRATDVEVFGRHCILTVVHDRRTERLADLGQAVRKILHDVRNTLSTAMMLAESLAQREDPQVERAAQQVLRSLDRAVAMCRRTLATGTAKEPAPQPAAVDLARLADEVLADVPARGVRTQNGVPAGLGLTADAGQLHRALLNLVRNAVFADGTTTVRLEAAAGDGTVTIDVVDDGPGLGLATPADGAIPTVTASTGGTGLGLAIADELVRNNGGRLAVVETGPAGTRFRAALPAQPSA